MNISYKWLREFIDSDLTPEQLAAALTSIGLEVGTVERVEAIPGGLRGLVVGRVLTCEPHPDSDHLHVTTVDLGAGAEPAQIVCGAPNVAAGQAVIVATIGTVLTDPQGREFKIKKSKMRGVESLGMICAEDEIGVGASHDGIIVIPDAEAPAPGTPAADYYGLEDDWVLEVDLTPNRIDAASHLGVARDLRAWLGVHHTAPDGAVPELRRPDDSAFAVQEAAGALAVQVDDPRLCPRYVGITVRGVRVGPSPEWLQRTLRAVGQRPINNIVDITNWILLGLGQPLHCFDAAKVRGGRVEVRRCPAGTRFTTLDGVERTLDAADLMICDAQGPMCIAGVFGGLESGVTDQTTDIFIESACFNPTSIRRTARRHGLSTDASFRYERGLDPEFCLYAGRVAALMVQALAGGRVCGPVQDVYPHPEGPYRMSMSRHALDALTGAHVPADVTDRILSLLEIRIQGRSEDDDRLDLMVPRYRVDVTRECDVIEDVLRVYGYDNVPTPTEVHSCLSYKTPTDAADDLRRTVADQLCGAGFCEILNNSLTAVRYYEPQTQALWPLDRCVRLLNPLSADLGVMRQTLLFGGLEVLSHNINRREADLALYEFGNTYTCRPDVESTAERPLAPFGQRARLGLWLTGHSRQPSWARPADKASFYDLRAHVDNILTRLGLADSVVAAQTGGTDVMAAAMELKTRKGGQLVGTMGIVAPRLLRQAADIRQEVYYAELDWTDLTALAAKSATTFAPLPRAMGVRRDLALLLDKAVTFDQVRATVRDAERRLLRDVSLFDVYEDPKGGLPQGKKSYAIALTLRDDDRTLTDKAIDQAMTRVIAALRTKLGAELR